jgi:ABC-2 type transport system permease protein
MNASTFEGDVRAPMAAPHATHKFKLLLRREFWEHKGGFFWAPIWASGISLLLTMMAVIVGEVMARRAIAEGHILIKDGARVPTDHVTINGLDLGAITGRMSAEDMQNLGHGVDLSLLTSSSWPFIVLGFVTFFYCLGAMYDERKDRSVLFWKSLPVSDTETVLSKVASALVVAPAIAIGVAVVTMFVFLALMSVLVLIHGGNPIQLLWGPGNPLAVAGHFIASLPIYALWALPTVGWLMLCSAWARTKPFLWAVMIPVFAGIFVAWFDIMNVFNLDTAWFWQHVVARALTSVFPGMWLTATNLHHVQGPEQLSSLIGLQQTYSVIGTPQLWIGAIVGAAMIFGAIRLRRWRDDN